MATLLAATNAFTATFVRPTFLAATTRLFAGPEQEEEGMDLDLGEMFEMFDAAEKDEDFDETMKKVKTEGSDD